MKIKNFIAVATSAILAVGGTVSPAMAAGGTMNSWSNATFMVGAASKTADLAITFDNTDFQTGYFTLDTATAGCDALPSGLAFAGNYGVGSPAAAATDPELSITGTPARSVAAGDYDLCVESHGPASETDSITITLTIAGYNPAEFTPRGTSWVSVPFADRIYAKTEQHFTGTSNEYDDDSIHYLPAGESCEIDADNDFEGPALIVDGQPTCTNSAQDADAGIPIGFTVNFGGQSFTDIYLTTNGMLAFDPQQDDYDNTLSETAVNNQSSGISALGMDLGFYSGSTAAETTNIWIANDVTVDGKPAFVATWENAGSHGDENLKADFQIVLMDNGGGDFDAWFNYDRVEVNDQGYSDDEIWVDLIGGKQSTNKYFAYDKEFLTVAQCETMGLNNLLNKDGTARQAGDEDYDAISATTPSVMLNGDGSVSLFTDGACSTAFVPSSDTKYLRANVDVATNFNTIPVGWYVYNNSNPADVVILPTEFFPNSDQDLLVDGGGNQLIAQSVNTTVPGRYVLWMTGGATGGDVRSIAAQVEEQFASTPIDVYTPPTFTFGSPSMIANNTSTLFTVLGTRLNAVVKASINGIPVEIVSMESGKIVFRLPALPEGTYDLVTVAQNEVLTFKKAVVVGASSTVAAANPYGFVSGKAKSVVGFAGDSAVLTAKQKKIITSGVSVLNSAKTLTCTGSTSNRAVTPADRALARSRSVAACNYAKKLNPSLTTVIRTAPSSAVGTKARNVTLKFTN